MTKFVGNKRKYFFCERKIERKNIFFSYSNGSITNRQKKRLSESKEAQRRNSEAREVKNEMSKLIETEEAMIGTVTWALYGRYFKRMGILLSIVAIGSNLLYHTASVYSNGIFLLFLQNS